jgi:adenylate kinase family enzyme
VYRDQTEPLIEHFKKMGKLVDIDGSLGIDGVFAQMVRAVDKIEK